MKKILFFIFSTFAVSSLSFAQPANDDCTGAISLTAGVACSFGTYTNVSATATTSPATPPAPGCGNYLGGDVWFSVTVPASGHLIFDTRTPSGGLTDIAMAIYSGACGALSLIECDDDDSDNGTYMPKIDRTGLTPGATIYIRVWEYGNNSFGNFELCVYEPAGTGPCASVISIDCGIDQIFTASGSGAWNAGICGTGTPGQEQIYAFTPATSGPYILNITYTGSDWMSYAYQEGSCSSTGWNCITRTDATGNYGPMNMTAGVTYFIMVDCEDASSGNQHTFRIRCPETPGTYLHPTDGIQGTYNGACMVNTCTGTYVDDGNAGNYSNSINSIYRTFCPDAPGKCMTATINSFILENSSGCANDALIIRDGPTQGSSMLWGGCGNWTASLPVTITSTNSSGCLTFQFWSNAITNYAGWNISLGCTDCAQASQTNNDCVTATPICGATNLNSASPGPGLTSTCGGCNLSENFSNWYYFEITSDGRLALDMKPEDFFEDYDLALYQADTCSTLGDPVRCSYAMTPQYCRPISDNTSYYISNVTFNTINNTSTYNSSFYSNNTTSIETTVNEGSTYSLQVTVVGSGMEVVAWIDWDKSLTFDSDEYYMLGSGSGTLSTNITVSAADLRPGKTGMRVYTSRSGYPPSTGACNNYANGEIEDYAIFINDGTHCSNNLKDADETGVDCGGVDCVPCTENYWPTNTGMASTAPEYSEDVTGDSWVSWINVTAGQRYYLMVNNWSPGADGFDLVWQFSEGGAMDCDIVPLPVELLSFDATCNEGLVNIEWEVASETNNDYFVVLKSYNNIAYASVDTIDGRGNANSYQKYSVSYQEENPGSVYYKLKQVDFDGAFAYSDPVVATCGAENRTFSVMPNPVRQGENWKISNLTIDDEVHIYDIYGREWSKDNLDKGMYTIVVNGKPVSKLIVY